MIMMITRMISGCFLDDWPLKNLVDLSPPALPQNPAVRPHMGDFWRWKEPCSPRRGLLWTLWPSKMSPQKNGRFMGARVSRTWICWRLDGKPFCETVFRLVFHEMGRLGTVGSGGSLPRKNGCHGIYGWFVRAKLVNMTPPSPWFLILIGTDIHGVYIQKTSQRGSQHVLGKIRTFWRYKQRF